MHKYRLIAKKGEGTFSEVLKAQSVVSGEFFAVKCMKNHFKSIDQVNSLREIQALRRLNPHDNIIPLEEVLFDEQSGRLALVFELMDMNIYELIRGRTQYLKPSLVTSLMHQLLKAVAHMHKNGIFHRDIKPENILVQNEQLKIADLGSCRGMFTKQPFTEYISTRWYRAPECLLTNGYYDAQMDLWGVGCVMFEIVSMFPLFPGTNELNQIEKIHAILGTPTPEMIQCFKKHSSHIAPFNFEKIDGTGIKQLIPNATAEALDLIEQLVAYMPEDRISAKQALKHSYFRQGREGRLRTASPKLHEGRSLAEQEKNQGLPSMSKAKKKDKKKSGKVNVSMDSGDEFACSESQGPPSPDAAKELSLAPSIIKQPKSKKQKEKKGFNSSATNLPTIMAGGLQGSSMASNHQSQASSMASNHLSLNITGYKPKNPKGEMKKDRQKKKAQGPHLSALKPKQKNKKKM